MDLFQALLGSLVVPDLGRFARSSGSRAKVCSL